MKKNARCQIRFVHTVTNACRACLPTDTEIILASFLGKAAKKGTISNRTM